MSENTKLQPEDLTAEERALWDALAVERVARNSCRPEQAYEFTDDWASRLILARRALFATEKAKCVLHEEIVRDGPSKWTCETQPDPAKEKAVCPNCKRDDTGHSWKVNGELRYSCNGWNKPAQPEPAAPVTGSTPISEYDPDMKPAAPEMPEAVRDVLQYLRFTSGTVANDRADALESWWRTHSQPVAVGMSGALERVLDCAEMDANRDRMGGHETTADRTMAAIREVRQQAAQGKPKVELPCPFCGAAPEVSRPSGRSEWIPESAGLGSAGWSGPVTEASCRACGVMRVPLVIWNRRTHSQPVAVGMTEELSMVLLRAEYGATEDERNPNLRDGYVARLKDAIAAVRQQAAQVAK